MFGKRLRNTKRIKYIEFLTSVNTEAGLLKILISRMGVRIIKLNNLILETKRSSARPSTNKHFRSGRESGGGVPLHRHRFGDHHRSSPDVVQPDSAPFSICKQGTALAYDCVTYNRYKFTYNSQFIT